MRNSNLAERLELFLAIENATVLAESKAPRAVAVAATVHGMPRRISLTTRRILLRDPGLRQFRVY